MASNRKTDNHNIPAKLALRRHFLSKYHADQRPAVLDCCQGSGKLWKALGEEFDVSVWGMDLKPKPGRLKLDSARYLGIPGWEETIIDVDTYGSPWKHWAALPPNVTRPLTVFLTIGATMFRGSVDNCALDAMGLRFQNLHLPESFCGKLSLLSLPYCLNICRRYGVQLSDVIEAPNEGSARYLGMRLIPKPRGSGPA